MVYMLTLGVYWWDPCYHIYQHHGSYGYDLFYTSYPILSHPIPSFSIGPNAGRWHRLGHHLFGGCVESNGWRGADLLVPTRLGVGFSGLVYLWFTFGLPLVYLGLPWFTFGLPLVYLGLPWFTLVYLGLPWFTLVYLGLPWFILVYLWTWQGKKETPILTEFCCQTVSIIPDHVTGKQLLPCSPQQRNWGSSRRSCYWVLGIWSKCSPVLHIRVVWSTQRYSPSKQWLLIGRLREGPSASWEVERSVVTYKSDGKVLVGDVAVAQRGSLPCHRWMKCVGSHPFLGWKKTTGLGKIWSASIIT